MQLSDADAAHGDYIIGYDIDALAQRYEDPRPQG
jgi:hypothetical protein